MTDASRYLATLARQVAAVYVASTGPRAILLAGSVAEGVSDYYSDLDLVDEIVAPVEAHMPDVDTAAVRRLIGARQHPWRQPEHGA